MKSALALIPLALLAACKQSDSAGSPAAPVAAVAAPAGTEWVTTVKDTPDGGVVMGNPNAAIKLIEYGSRTCPHCAKFSAESSEPLKALVATGKVSYEFRDFPIHAPDLAAILLGRCGGTATFFPILEQMMAAQPTMLPLVTREAQQKGQAMSPAQAAGFWADTIGYRNFVQQRGVTADAANKCLANQAAIDQIDARLKEASDKYAIDGTPTFILNGTKLDNVNEWAGVKAALTNAGA